MKKPHPLSRHKKAERPVGQDEQAAPGPNNLRRLDLELRTVLKKYPFADGFLALQAWTDVAVEEALSYPNPPEIEAKLSQLHKSLEELRDALAKSAYARMKPSKPLF